MHDLPEIRTGKDARKTVGSSTGSADKTVRRLLRNAGFALTAMGKFPKQIVNHQQLWALWQAQPVKKRLRCVPPALRRYPGMAVKRATMPCRSFLNPS